VPHVPSIFDWLEPFVATNRATVVLNVVLVGVVVLLIRREMRRDDSVIPSERLTVRNFFELLLEGIVGQMRTTIGPEWHRFAPVVGTLGLFILISNLLGLVPGLTGPTSFIETNLAWALLSFVTYNMAGIQHHGFGYVKQFLGPVPWLAPLMFPIELISHLSRIMSLTVRLTANMFADHTLVAIFLSFPLVQIFVPWLMMGLGLFVAFLQAFIFAYLTTVYIGMALQEEH
jgi:F-type H+-transporting ATPase subunit a